MLGRYSSSCKVKLTVQRAAPPLPQMVGEDDDQLLTPPSVVKIITGQVTGITKTGSYIYVATNLRGM